MNGMNRMLQARQHQPLGAGGGRHPHHPGRDCLQGWLQGPVGLQVSQSVSQSVSQTDRQLDSQTEQHSRAAVISVRVLV